jgi:hypothetical protein
MRRISFPSWSVPIVFLGVTLAAYGLFATQQGYHWDDWGIAWMGHYIGKPGLDAYFAITRPVWSNLFVFTTSLIGPDPMAWQIFGLAARWLEAVALWWVLRLTWPGHSRLAFTTALLALLYPGFSQHSIALVYGHYSLTFAVFFVSVALGLLSMQTVRLRWLMLIGGVILSALHLFSVEYYFGLELLRPVLMWVAAGETTRAVWPRLWRTLRAYIPFGLVLIAYVLWRVFGFQSEVYGVELLGQSAVTFSSLVSNAAHSIWTASVAAWSNLFHVSLLSEMDTRLVFRCTVILLAALLGIDFFLARLHPATQTPTPESGKKPFLEWFAVGVLAILLAGIPFVVANLEVKLTFPFDRFTQPFALGTALILAAGLELLPKLSWRALGTGVLAAFAIGVQIQNAFAFREDWRAQETYFWELIWRAPALRAGTVIVSEDSPFRFTDDDALTFAINWLYAPDYEHGNLPYGQVFLFTRPGKLLTPGQPVEWHLLSADFISSTDSMLIVQFDTSSCLRVLHPVYDADLPLAPLSGKMADSLSRMGYPILRQGTWEALPLSNMDQVISNPEDPAHPPEVVFGKEPPHQWCYYFEKADLARAGGDWAEVARLGDEAFAVPFHPNNLSEYLPFIEAYTHLGRMKEAKKLTLDSAHQMPVLRPALCALWQRVSSSASLSESDRSLAGQVQSDLQYCPVENINE